MNHTTAHLASITGAQTLYYHQDLSYHSLLLDSRKVLSPSACIFFAIRGNNHDGHRYIHSLYQKGVRNFIIESPQSIQQELLPEANIWHAQSSITALQKLAAHHRSLFSIPVIGITGSNGKTIVKEWLAQLLQKDYRVVKNPKSYNSQIGVPISVWELNSAHTLGIFEAGISQPGEMEQLEPIIRPTIGILTNIGPAHDEGFQNTEQKIAEKLKLFAHCQILFYRKDNPLIAQQVEASGLPVFSWSTQAAADVQLLEQQFGQHSCILKLKYRDTLLEFEVPFADEASIENCMHSICLLLYLHVSSTEIQRRLQTLAPVAMRLELKKGINGCYLIDDTYNNDLAGLTMAVNFLDQQKQQPRKTIILSDLFESGIEEKSLYAQIAKLLADKGITKVFGIGPTISKYHEAFRSLEASFYNSTEDFLKEVSPQAFANEIILLKGARTFQFENIVKVLLQKMHGTVLEINLDALAHNLNFYRAQLKPGTKLMAMVKAFAYGSGSFEVANLLQYHRVDYLTVAYADEGVALRENGITMPVMVMNPSYNTFDKLIQYQLEPELYSFKILNEFLQYLADSSAQALVHLKLDTGMHRLGFEEKDLEQLLQLLASHPAIRIASVFTHLAGADEAIHNDFTKTQLHTFERMAQRIDAAIGYQPLRHALNSAGIIRFPEAQMDMVRLGIGLYGVEANGLMQSSLQTVGTLKTIISQIKKVPSGESIGYSRKGRAQGATTIATIAIGYADGYDRRFSNGKGMVLVHDRLCPIIGNVCMDMCMVDITGVDAAEGDEVVVFGDSPSIIQLAKAIDTIPYEILTGIGERVKRVFYTE
jgi:alanine racemase